MLRRKGPSRSTSGRTPVKRTSSKPHSHTSDGGSLAVWVVLAVAITILTYAFPDRVAQLEQDAVQQVEERMGWTGPQQESSPVSVSQVTGVSWVQGEKLLKQELKKLAARQAEGKDLGVPVLSRYLGPDVSAWPAPGTEKEWQATVDAKYAAMRTEEEAWRERVTAQLNDKFG